MDLLQIGGTRFAGRWTTERALAAGHRVTLLHRGKTGADLFPEAEHVLADRDGGTSALGGRRFDAVIDWCGFYPRVVRQSVEALRDSGHYTFISSISAYADGLPDNATEDAPLHPVPDDLPEELTEQTYGPLKVACERVVAEAFGARAALVRPGFVVGPHDPSDRFPSLLRRAAAGGEMLLYGPPGGWLQLVDARDLAAFVLHLAETGTGGAFSAIHPRHTATVADVVEAARAHARADTRFVWVDPGWLKEQLGDDAGDAFPMWDPDPASHFSELDGSRAAAAGLPSRAVAETVADTLDWDRSRGADAERPHGLAPDRERALLDAWRAPS